jgi:hypothetical protein
MGSALHALGLFDQRRLPQINAIGRTILNGPYGKQFGSYLYSIRGSKTSTHMCIMAYAACTSTATHIWR